MKKLLLILGIIWASPITLPVFLAYFGPFWLFRWHRFHGWEHNAWVWTVSDTAPEWLKKAWSGWGGQAIGNLIILKGSSQATSSTLVHEQEHVRQCMRAGIFQVLFYGLGYLMGVIAGHVNPYYSNPFEIAARVSAGQQLKHERFVKKED